MTLIDIEDLKKWRMNRIQAGNCNHDDMTALGAFIDNVDKIEQKQGKWEKYYSSLICPICKAWTLGNNGSIKPYAYCPHCGARMDGERGE